MDFFVKIEPQDTISEEYVNDECILCDEGKKYYNLLVQHFQNYHKSKKIIFICRKRAVNNSLYFRLQFI